MSVETMTADKLLLHVGCGPKRRNATTRTFAGPGWRELRFDIDPAAKPDLLGSITDMSAVADRSVDALFTSHTVEHLFWHEVPVAFAEFRRVLRPDGFAVITCPNLKAIAEMVVQDRLTEPAYVSPSGPITPLDVIFGHGASLKAGRLYMAHRCGFSETTLRDALVAAGFAAVVTRATGATTYDLWAVATAKPLPRHELIALAEAHFPS